MPAYTTSPSGFANPSKFCRIKPMPCIRQSLLPLLVPVIEPAMGAWVSRKFKMKSRQGIWAQGCLEALIGRQAGSTSRLDNLAL